MLTKDVRFNEDLYIVKDIVRVDRAVTRTREDVETSEDEDIYQIREQYKDRGETKKAIALYYRLRNELKRLCIQSELGMACRESDVEAIEELEKKYQEQVKANKFEHVQVSINICLVRVSNANSKVYKQISEDLRNQVATLTDNLRVIENQKRSVENNLKNVTHTVDEIKEAIKTVDIAKLARDSQFLDPIMNFNIDNDTKESIKKLKDASSNLIKEVRDWKNNTSRFDFLIVEGDKNSDDSTS